MITWATSWAAPDPLRQRPRRADPLHHHLDPGLGPRRLFGADCSQQSDRASGLFVDGLYDFDSLFGVDFSTSKEQRVNTCESAMNHAMLFTGVDIDEAGAGRRFRVENSWGEAAATRASSRWTPIWFDANVFEVAVHVATCPPICAPPSLRSPSTCPRGIRWGRSPECSWPGTRPGRGCVIA